MNVDLPQPEGPIKAQTDFSGIDSEILNSACDLPYQKDKSRMANLVRTRVKFGDRPISFRSEMIAE
jgi:hypothetical protein